MEGGSKAELAAAAGGEDVWLRMKGRECWRGARAGGEGAEPQEIGAGDGWEYFFIFNLFLDFILKITHPDKYLHI